MPFYEAGVRPVQILSAVPGKLHGKPIIALSVRADPCNSFGVTDVAISKAQAIRLRNDLAALLQVDQPIWSEPE